MIDARRYRYAVEWSRADEQFVGTCDDFPNLSWLTDDQVGALEGITRLVANTLEDMQLSGESLPAPKASSESAEFMTSKELQALRKFLLIDVKEAAELIGKVSPRTWQHWESGRNRVPNDVADKLGGVLTMREIIISEIEAEVDDYSDDPRQEDGQRLSFPYYGRFSDYNKDYPDKGILAWRAYQSAVSELFASNLITLV